jgi:hypothetical protein
VAVVSSKIDEALLDFDERIACSPPGLVMLLKLADRLAIGNDARAADMVCAIVVVAEALKFREDVEDVDTDALDGHAGYMIRVVEGCTDWLVDGC